MEVGNCRQDNLIYRAKVKIENKDKIYIGISAVEIKKANISAQDSNQK